MSPRSFSKKAAGHDVQDAISWHASVLLMLFVFVILTSFALALWVLKVQLKQQDLTTAVNIVATKTLIGGKTEDTETGGIIKKVAVGLRPEFGVDVNTYLNVQCPDTGNPNCYDYSITGPKATGLFIPSVRQVMAAAGLETAGFPMAIISDRSLLTLRAGNPENGKMLNRLVTVNLNTGVVKQHPSDVDQCATFSEDGQYAADMPLVRDERRQVVVHDLLNGTSKVVANAKKAELYGVIATGSSVCDKPLFVNATSVRFDVFTSPDATHATSSLIETRTVEFKF
jgi:hypothetical protein